MGLYELSLSMSLLGFGMWTMLANSHMAHEFNMLMKNVSPRWLSVLGASCLVCHDIVRCYFYVVFITSWIWLW